MKPAKKIFLAAVLSCLALFLPPTTGGNAVFAQGKALVPSAVNGEYAAKEKEIRQGVEFLCDSLFHGRAMGTPGSFEAGAWIARNFENIGLMPSRGVWAHRFGRGTMKGRNIIGFLPGKGDRYLIIAAHYDNLGILAGSFYPGADSNASGTVAMVTLARMLARMNSLGKQYSGTVIFAALDGKEKNSAGAHALWDMIEDGRLIDPVKGAPVTKGKITAIANIDMVGSTLSPVHPGREDYLLAISAGRFDMAVNAANSREGLGLDICRDYYGSRDFTNIFYRRTGDHRPFMEHGIPAVLFTSGITMRTNREGDTPASLDYAVLRKRILLIYYWTVRMI